MERRLGTVPSGAGTGGRTSTQYFLAQKDFSEEVQNIAREAMDSGSSAVDIVREIKNLKLKMDATFLDCISATCPIILADINLHVANVEKTKILEAIYARLDFWKPLYLEFSANDDEKIHIVDVLWVLSRSPS
jgi:hypothetical protein